MQWPPPALASGFSLSAGKAIMRTDMESGHARQRRSSASMPERVKVQWVLRGAELKVWRSWWKYTLLDGTIWFSCVLTDGAASVTANCRFVTEPDISEQGAGVWIVSGEIEAEDLPLLSQAELEAYLAS